MAGTSYLSRIFAFGYKVRQSFRISPSVGLAATPAAAASPRAAQPRLVTPHRVDLDVSVSLDQLPARCQEFAPSADAESLVRGASPGPDVPRATALLSCPGSRWRSDRDPASGGIR